MSKKRAPWARLKKVKSIVGGEIRKSRNDVPMLVANIGGGTCVGVAWLSKGKMFRVVEPYPGDEQTRHDFASAEEAAEHVLRRVRSYIQTQVRDALKPFVGMTAEEMRQRNTDAVIAGELAKLHKELGHEPTVERVLTDITNGTMYAQFRQVRGLNGGPDA